MLAAGTTLGPYKILAPLGAGGMGEVYRAHDSRLGRDVAIKVLPSRLAATLEVRARFEREARTISQLNHPHICTLYDVGHQDGVDYLVMELIEGETLAHRLEKGPLPVAEVLSLGRQIAEALDRAHRAGVVHRDLKPGNVMLTKGGAKLMDFGLARAHAAGPVAGALTESPTMSRPLTAEGTIVGTFQYMAPEQLEGKEADARSDLWALGCVLYEMATGRRAFDGKSQASLIAAIIEREPTPPSQLAPLLPPALDRVVQQCLTKDPDERIQTAHDVKLQLQWIASGGSQAGVPTPVAARRRSRQRIAWLLAGALALAVVALGSPLLLRRSEPPRVVRLEVRPPRGATSIYWPRVSPDGRTLAFLAYDSTGVQRLWVRPVDGLEARPLEGLEGSARPFWSPDSRYLAFIAGGKLRKIPVAGGPSVYICDAPGGADGTWGKSGWILFDGSAGDSIRGVPAAGGIPKAITFVDRAHGETSHSWPFFLPDGRHFLFVASRPGTSDAIRMGALGSRESQVIGQTDSRAEYAPPGFLVYVNGGTLVAQPFDAGSARTTGDPVPVGENVGGSLGPFSVSSAGVLAYRSTASGGQARLVWVARDRHLLGEAAPPGLYEDVALSPDETRVALSIATEQPPTRDIWVRDLVRGVSSRLTFDPGDELAPAWSPDGDRLAYAKIGVGGMQIYAKAASGVGSEDSLAHTPGSLEAPFQWSGAANTIVLAHMGPSGQWDIYVMPADGRQAPRPFLQSPFREMGGRLSPDGQWLAYTSNETGRSEVCVVPYPGPGGKWQISTAGGDAPLWRADGRELFFQGADQSIMAVDVRAGATFEVGVPKLLFKTPLTGGAYAGYRWAVSRDGQRFLINTPSGAVTEGRLVVVTNWTTELRRR
jgi:serine/threonine protein kinase